MADFPGAIDIRTDHHWSGHAGAQPKWIIVHGTAGFTRAQDVGYFFQNNDPATSVHYVVGQDGVIVQCVAESDSAWGNGILTSGHDGFWDAVSPYGNPNWITFSIEHVKPSVDNSDQITDAQRDASFRLIKHLCDAHGVPPRWADGNGGITGHFSIDPVNRARCPGPYPWDDLFAYLGGAGGGSAGAGGGATGGSVPNGWRDDGQTLTAPNGFVVQHGFRAYVLAHAWQDWDWPLMNEAGRPEAELGNPKGPGTFQLFRTRQLVYFQSDGTISESWIGLAVQYLQNEVNDVQAALAAANGRVASLAQQLAQAQQQQQSDQGGQAPAPASDPEAAQALSVLKALDAVLAGIPAQS